MGLFGATPQATNTFSTTTTTFGAPTTFGATGQQMFGVPTAVSATTMTPFGNPSASFSTQYTQTANQTQTTGGGLFQAAQQYPQLYGAPMQVYMCASVTNTRDNQSILTIEERLKSIVSRYDYDDANAACLTRVSHQSSRQTLKLEHSKYIAY
jgi:hypothetical protein